MNVNKVIFAGRLTRDPEVRFTNNGTAVCKFSIAVNRKFKNAQGNYDVDFFDCVAWRKLGELVAKHTKKGSIVLVEGAMQNNNYQKQDGTTVRGMELNVSDAQWVWDNRNSGNGNGRPDGMPANPQVQQNNNANELNQAVPEVDDIDFEDVPF